MSWTWRKAVIVVAAALVLAGLVTAAPCT